ncbi:L-rhamnose isomerase [bacterium]|nr:L-rhamnose isomerase [bacterium]
MLHGSDRFEQLAEDLRARGIDVEQVVSDLIAQRIETPSWGYANSGTRFGIFRQPGAARNLQERLADAAQVHRLTGIAPAVAIHIPWDRSPNYAEIKAEADRLGMAIGAVNPNVFEDQPYKLGSFGNPDPAIRQRALDHMDECMAIMIATGSKALSLWFADGTNFPGQDSIVGRKRAFEEFLGIVYRRLPQDARMLVEYKPFEPAFYHTDIGDWGMATLLCQKLGPKAKVLVDLGHHYHGQNIEQIVAWLVDEKMLGGFHFNNRKYADDDLTTGSINPYEVFLIYHELVSARATGIDYMIDQSHNLKPKIEAMIQTVLFLQGAYARALIVPRQELARAQRAGDIVLAEGLLQQAFQTDVEPILVHVRERLGVPAQPLAEFRRSGYLARIEKERSL